MPRIAGTDLNLAKNVDIALTSIYGIGRHNVFGILQKAEVEGGKRVKDLDENEVNRIQKALGGMRLAGDLRAEVMGNIKRLKNIGSYRGLRHNRNLPVRGQRTKSNARTKRGKRMTIGAISKKVAERMGLIQKETKTPGEKSNK